MATALAPFGATDPYGLKNSRFLFDCLPLLFSAAIFYCSAIKIIQWPRLSPLSGQPIRMALKNSRFLFLLSILSLCSYFYLHSMNNCTSCFFLFMKKRVSGSSETKRYVLGNLSS